MWGGGEYSLSLLKDRLKHAFSGGRSSSPSPSPFPSDVSYSSSDSTNGRCEEGCSIRKVIKSKCNTQEVEPGSGQFVRKCHKTEQLFKDCLGRPTELVESKTEYTEDDVSRDSSVISNPLDENQRRSEFEQYIPPILHDDFDNFQRGLFGGLDYFVQSAEEMARSFFQGLRFPENSGETQNPFERFEEYFEREPYKQNRREKSNKEENIFGEFSEDFEEI